MFKRDLSLPTRKEMSALASIVEHSKDIGEAAGNTTVGTAAIEFALVICCTLALGALDLGYAQFDQGRLAFVAEQGAACWAKGACADAGGGTLTASGCAA